MNNELFAADVSVILLDDGLVVYIDESDELDIEI